ncbi:hypothetical protein PHJA_000200700 [Phtheirospermum japonicum]|uniref:Josephin-like protein n=1 Tax=Phtheirospermum japonicum TaxID=374723 RepID=A0A830B7V1_9LAMI|nr:hypothetical protein PHJA_000200700 [Phtheirospermum japonicum]
MRYAKHVYQKVAAVAVRVTSNNNNNNKEMRAKTSVAPVDSQRAEAIHDCIDFINSSSSLPRSNSVVAR